MRREKPVDPRVRLVRADVKLKRHVGPVSDAHTKAWIVTTAALMRAVARAAA